MPTTFVEQIYLTSPLHDIGKIGIPDSILLKTSSLTPEERAVVQSHCSLGAKILVEASKGRDAFLAWKGDRQCGLGATRDNPLMRMAADIAVAHHERWDGAGYPSGMAGAEIPVEARVVALADVYDALGSDRPYKTACTQDEVISIMTTQEKGHFDPEALGAFLRVAGELHDMRVELSEPAPEPGGATDEADSVCR